MTESLNALVLPLQGSHLIEASAGTGKTWTIAALYVRLVLGHGCEPRLPGDILVMTFTRAATRELSDRIRRRLVEAAAGFRGEPIAADDVFLAGLVADFPEGAPRQQGAWRLAMAAEAMDDAAVHTIDAWCHRMLREHAFDSGSLFDETLQAQLAAMRAEAVRDYWRQQVYPLGDAVLAQVLDQWKDLGTLEAGIQDLLDQPVPESAGKGSLAEHLTAVPAAREAALRGLKRGWAERADELRDWFGAVRAAPSHPAHSTLPRPSDITRWTDALRAWAQEPAPTLPDLSDTARAALSGAALREQFAMQGLVLVLPDCLDAFRTLSRQLDTLPNPGSVMRLHAAAQVRARMQVLKARAGTFGFADLLERLDRALDASAHGERASRLRERILAQYPVAMIDEFQDTSPLQLRIFDRLYRIASHDTSRLLLLIGDPKQAIYQFRGADIQSYLSARRATEGRHHVLGVNRRSTSPLVSAVNAMFQGAEDRPGEGAFLFRRAGANAALPFIAVAAHGRAEQLVDGSGEVPPITFVVDATLRSMKDAQRVFADRCAQAIVERLNDPLAGFQEPGQPFRRLRPADIAVLVRSGTEARAVRQAMSRRGLASVYLSDKDTVFQTPEAADLLRLLQAVAAPRDIRLARAALATRLLGFPLSELMVLATDDQAFDRQCERLQALNQVWQTQGVLAMIRQALHAFGLPARWLGAHDPSDSGERRLTNILHLAELLQAAAAQLEGAHVTVRWLQQQLHEANAGLNSADDLLLRLESDADLVKVVTVHKSKGLEYPVVFLPFAAHLRDPGLDARLDRHPVFLLPADDDSGDARELVLTPGKDHKAQQAREQLRENLRLLYVALTRARHALWIGLSALKIGNGKDCVWPRSAIGYLLSGPQPCAPDALIAAARACRQACPLVSIQALGADDTAGAAAFTRLQPRQALLPLAALPEYAGSFERDWSISSYTALVRDAGRAGTGASAGSVPARVLRNDEPDAAVTDAAAPDAPVSLRADAPWHRFPRGALAGNFLHDQLEWLAGEGFGLAESTEPPQRLLRRCERQGWGHRADDVLAWLRQVCATPLPPLGVPLAGLGSPTPEMEFWFPSDGLDADRLDVLCRAHLHPGKPRPLLPQRSLKGMLMGFADLVFEHGGRYWVLDYKSNHLGPDDDAYSLDAMNAAICEHRYDVQATLYLLALHRLLRVRLGASYRPAQHLGGALYLFLRGVNGPAAGCCPIVAPLELIAQVDGLLPGGQTSAAPEAT